MIGSSARDLPTPTRNPAALEGDIDAFGYCLPDRALPPETVAAILERLDEQATAKRRRGHHRLSQVQDPDGVNQWINMLLNKGRVFQELLFHPLVGSVVEHLLGPHYLLSDLSAHLTRPGNSMLPLHMDQ